MKKNLKAVLSFAMVLVLAIPVLCFTGCKKNKTETMVLDKTEIYVDGEIKSVTKVSFGKLNVKIGEDGNTFCLDDQERDQCLVYQLVSGDVTQSTEESPFILNSKDSKDNSFKKGEEVTLNFVDLDVSYYYIMSGERKASMYPIESLKLTIPSEDGYTQVVELASRNAIKVYIRFHFSLAK